MQENNFIKEVNSWGIKVPEKFYSQVDAYHSLLTEKNQQVNLVSRHIIERAYNELYLDSMMPVKAGLFAGAASCCDIGTGGGIPGLILGMFYPDMKVLLVESIRKKVLFLEAVISRLELNNVEIYHGRAEELPRITETRFDRITFKAFGRLKLCLTLGLPVLGTNGMIVAYKGAETGEEIQEAKRAFFSYTFDKNEYILPEYENTRSIITVKAQS
jgi:16S rRNA (guanine527-N7)-methyltransferase